MPPKRTGQKLLRFDRNLGARFVAGADEAGRGPLAGPLVVAGVLLDYECLRDHRVRPLARLNDSKQVDEATRDELYHAVLSCAERVSVHVYPPAVIDREGLHKSNLRGYRILDTNRWLGGAELDLVVRRGRRLVFVEVKSKSGTTFGDPLEMVDETKVWRLRTAADAWLARHPELRGLEVRFDVIADRAGRLQHVPNAF